ncbi:glycosyl hydrolase family 18 protein [Priestia megaterium]|uniref:glycosyl hydrolase family 18 protein n=1 Tax=Priestia megaterium TaxID=1404 RepID=UPI0021D682B1|nr:glycosyl hydrolase family 18 protein [Priestia megaterium]MCU7766362.1 glycosyl hydrolase family 18 protein [Priestia megaterium]
MEHKPLIMGYWQNWATEGARDGYENGTSAEVDLTDVPKEYNMIVVSYMKGAGIPTFNPFNKLEEKFREQIDKLALEGRQVVLGLGGADAYIELTKGNEKYLADEIIRLVDFYGFSGICINLEQSAIDAADNQTVIPAALKSVKDYYKNEGKHFLIALAPEFPYLSLSNGKYLPYLSSLEGYYDLVCSQLYNQGGDGMWVEEMDQWLSQDNNESKEDFLYYMMDSLASGTRGYTTIPHDKLVMGLPANKDAAATGYVIDPSAVLNVMKRLKQSGNAIRGLSAWSINWDAGQDKNGQSYSYEFIKRYKDIVTPV